MKKSFALVVSLATVLTGCSSEWMNEPAGGQAPISFNVQKKNITKATSLEDTRHYNFGVWAYKTGGKNSLPDGVVMENYMVGWSNNSTTTPKGYDPEGSVTYNESAGTVTDNTSPWFYQGLGTAEYTSPKAGYYQATDTDYLSNNANQYLHYWDLAYANTNFYCYAPYVNNDETNHKKVSFTHVQGGTSTLTFEANTLHDGYDNTVNQTYAHYDRSLSEFMYAGVKATNSNLSDVVVPFKHMGAMASVRFYEDIPGYKVEIIDLGEDNGNMATGTTGDMAKGIQLTPAKVTGTTYSLAEYYTTSGATVSFDDTAVSSEGATFTPKFEGSTTVSTPLMFAVPDNGLTDFAGHKVIREDTHTGTQDYSTSPTIYYAVAQPTSSETGFTVHVSYRIIAEDNHEVVTVHNATVHVPYKDNADRLITVWQPNTKYTYTFRITTGTTGSTDPDVVIDPAGGVTPGEQALYPIVFDQATIEDYTEIINGSEVDKQ